MVKKKYRVLETVTTVDGTLYKEELVTFENKEDDGDWRVKDNMGRIWYVNPKKLTEIDMKTMYQHSMSGILF